MLKATSDYRDRSEENLDNLDGLPSLFLEWKRFFSWKDGQIKILFLNLQSKMTHGVTGNTSDFGSEESRFEP